MQTTYTASAGDKVSFYWKVSSESSDYLRFYIDGQLQNYISGQGGWEKESYALSAGSRTLRWVYEKDSDTSEGYDCGWVDGLYVGPSSGSLDPEAPGMRWHSKGLEPLPRVRCALKDGRYWRQFGHWPDDLAAWQARRKQRRRSA